MKISVLLPVYEGEQFLNETLQNLKDQTYNNFEVIILDNLSKDATPEICKQFCIRDKRFRYYLDTKKRNGNDCISEIIKYAEGNYCMVVNDDNFFDHRALEFLVKEISNKQNIDWVIFNGKYVNIEGKKINNLLNNSNYLNGSPGIIKVIRSFYNSDYVATLLCSIYKLDTFKKLLPYENLSKFENEADILMCLKIFSNLRIKFYNKDIMSFRVYENHERFHKSVVPKGCRFIFEKIVHMKNFIKSSLFIFFASRLKFYEKIFLILFFPFIYLFKKLLNLIAANLSGLKSLIKN